MKILFTVVSFLPQMGGSARLYYEICRHLPAGEACVLTQRRTASQKHDVSNWKQFDASQKFKIYRLVRLRPVMPKSDKKPALFISLCRFVFSDLPLMGYIGVRFFHVILKERPDIVCFDDPDHLGWLMLMNKYVLKKRSLFYLHGEELNSYSGGRRERLRFFYLSKADTLIVNSEFTKGLLAQHDLDSKAVVVRPGVNLSSPLAARCENAPPPYTGKKVILSINRLEPHKGIDRVIRAIPLVVKRFPDLVYLIGGEGSEEQSLKSLASQLKLQGIVQFLGYIPEERLPEYYDMCDIFVLANIEPRKGLMDGFGMVFIEANSRGKPVIGGNIGGVKEAIIDGETGFLVDGENINDIAEKIIRLLNDRDLARKLGENGKIRAKQFGWERVAKEFKKVCLGLRK